MPIRQFFYFDAIECLPENVFQASDEVFAPKLPAKNSRYYSQEIVFGADFQEKICKAKYFVVRNMIKKSFINMFDKRLVLVQLVVKC